MTVGPGYLNRVGEGSKRGYAAAVLLVATLLLAGCGAGGKPAATRSSATRPGPHIPPALAGALAARADRVAVDLRRGKSCAAAADAAHLTVALHRAVGAGTIPRKLQAPAQAAAADLKSRIVCRSPTTTSTPTTTTGTPTTTAGTSTTTAKSAPAPPTCAELQGRRQQLEQEKHALDQEKHAIDKLFKGPAAKARKEAIDRQRKAIDQAEHALDQRLHGCH